jgi:membrane protein implicated in regulation of membrane protease activity
MNPRSTRTLLWVSAILAAVGAMIGSPEAGVAVLGLAALCALAPIVAGPRWVRLAGVVLLLASLGMAFATYPAAKQQMERYR